MIKIPEYELEFNYSRSSGPGGQNVNKRDTKVTVRWNVLASRLLTSEQRQLLIRRLKNRINNLGELVISWDTERTQAANKKTALHFLNLLVTGALVIPEERQPTKPTRSSKEKRLQQKKIRSEKKQSRAKVDY